MSRPAILFKNDNFSIVEYREKGQPKARIHYGNLTNIASQISEVDACKLIDCLIEHLANIERARAMMAESLDIQHLTEINYLNDRGQA